LVYHVKGLIYSDSKGQQYLNINEKLLSGLEQTALLKNIEITDKLEKEKKMKQLPTSYGKKNICEVD
jgi:hypothetical protein